MKKISSLISVEWVQVIMMQKSELFFQMVWKWFKYGELRSFVIQTVHNLGGGLQSPNSSKMVLCIYPASLTCFISFIDQLIFDEIM